MEDNQQVVESRESTQIKSEPTGADAVAPTREMRAVEPKERETKETKELSLRKTLKAKFNEKEAAKPESSTTTAPQAATTGQVTQKSAATAAAILPPADMSAEEKAVFSNLQANPTPENVAKLQSYISRRAYEQRSDYTRKTMELAEREKGIGDILGVVEPVRDAYAKKGIAVPDLVRRAIAWDASFEKDRLGTAREFLDSYGIDPSELMDMPGQQYQQEPQGNYLTREEAEALADERVQRAFEMNQQQSLAAENHNTVLSFLESKPLFKDPGTAAQLENAMAPIVKAFRDSNPHRPVKEILDQAYDYVTKGDPTFSGLASQLNAKQDAERMQAEADKARAAGRSITGGPGSGTPKVKSKNMREALQRHFNG